MLLKHSLKHDKSSFLPQPIYVNNRETQPDHSKRYQTNTTVKSTSASRRPPRGSLEAEPLSICTRLSMKCNYPEVAILQTTSNQQQQYHTNLVLILTAVELHLRTIDGLRVDIHLVALSINVQHKLHWSLEEKTTPHTRNNNTPARAFRCGHGWSALYSKQWQPLLQASIRQAAPLP
jgi:hypothetical protein